MTTTADGGTFAQAEHGRLLSLNNKKTHPSSHSTGKTSGLFPRDSSNLRGRLANQSFEGKKAPGNLMRSVCGRHPVPLLDLSVVITMVSVCVELRQVALLPTYLPFGVDLAHHVPGSGLV